MVKAATAPKIVVDKEFSSLIPAISAEELTQLETNILRDGVLDSLVVWDRGDKQTLLDGHNRFRLCNKHGKPFRTTRLKFESRDLAKNWMIEHQLGRRNISDEQRRYLLGCLWREAAKAPVGRPSADNSETVSEFSAREIAEQHGVSDRTVRNAADYAEAVDAVAEKSPELKAAVLAGDVKATTADLEKLAEAPQRVVDAVAKKAAAGDAGAVKDAVKPKRSANGKPTYDDRIIDKLLGQVVRALDSRAKAYGGQGPKHAACVSSLNEFKADWDAWRKAGRSK